MTAESNWIRVWPARQTPTIRLVCFPYAGAGASMCNGWTDHLAADIDLLAVQLPGRETRLREEPLREFGPLKKALESVLPPYLDLPMALLGYSFGGTIAFEVARQMLGHEVPPCHLFVGAAVAPQADRGIEPISHLPDEQFLAAIQENFGGIPPQLVGHDELLQLVLPALRADMHCIENYNYQPAPPLPCPITAFGGTDDTVASLAALGGWQAQTSSTFTHRMFPGGHFFIRERTPQVMRMVSDKLALHKAEPRA
jgi:surfactin synthase thioesterase subunit